MSEASFAWVLLAAFSLDLLIGDPVSLPHPVRWMGRWITSWEKRLRKGPLSEKIAGPLLVIFLVSGTWLICAAALTGARAVHPVFGQGLHVVLIFYALSAKSLKTEALKVYAALKGKDLGVARRQLSTIVGRDVASLDETGVTRAAVETVAENLVDGVIAPLFYATIGGGPLAMAYKMVNTLDSMIGYKNERYRKFGWFAARLDDAANFIPARISAIVISLGAPLVKRSCIRTIKTAVRDGQKHLSPNAGIPEAAFAGALGIRLGGPNFYDGRLVEKPYIGQAIRSVEMEDIKAATRLMTASAFIWLLVCWGAMWVMPRWWP
ncbi:MAG: cobalamin biosynthesis protein CobD [Deltaproteobacteria bacterium]|nr:cobalamin biosynthesis protein CobD [Deltaproteobacteria bacterium]MBW2020150.1 cobalamin biosynthesis protein CobD [Deltaproteobacteria bacterium]MBW2075065.1 cobalamin biosynthesis protein CobD [Deltaproteobacteria bacterium]RLB81643.1 MAG: cobalamin biosynthesis protein CobD [Deltaproteobacteria bacterium]